MILPPDYPINLFDPFGITRLIILGIRAILL